MTSTSCVTRSWLAVIVGGLLLVALTGCPVVPPADNPGDGTPGDSTGGDTTGGSSTGSDNTGGDSTGGGSTGGDTSGGTGGDNTGGDTTGGGTGGDGTTGGTGGGTGGDGTGGGGTGGGGTGGDGGTEPGPAPTAIQLQRIVQSGDAVPRQPGAQFGYFGNPIIDDEGRIAFWASYTGGQGEGGLYVFQNDSLTGVVDDDPSRTGEVPGRPVANYFGDYSGLEAIQWNAGGEGITWGLEGRLIFPSRVRGPPGIRGIYRWRATDGDMLAVTDQILMTNLFPDANPPTFFMVFHQVGISDASIVSWVSRYSYGTTTNEAVLQKHGVFSSNGLATSILRDHRDSFLNPGDVPDQASNAYFLDFEVLSSACTNGDVLFQGTYIFGNGARGVYLARDGSLFRVVDNGTDRAFPGLPTGAIIGDQAQPYAAISVGLNTHIAIETIISENGTPRDAVILYDGSLWNELSGSGTAADRLLSGVNSGGKVMVLAGGVPHVGDGAGMTDLTTVLAPDLGLAGPQWQAIAGALNNNGRAMVHYTRSDGSPGIAFWTGDQMLTVADAAAGTPVAGADAFFAMSSPETDRPGRTSALNNRDEMVFRVADLGPDGQEGTADDTQAIYIARAIFDE